MAFGRRMIGNLWFDYHLFGYAIAHTLKSLYPIVRANDARWLYEKMMWDNRNWKKYMRTREHSTYNDNKRTCSYALASTHSTDCHAVLASVVTQRNNASRVVLRSIVINLRARKNINREKITRANAVGKMGIETRIQYRRMIGGDVVNIALAMWFALLTTHTNEWWPYFDTILPSYITENLQANHIFVSVSFYSFVHSHFVCTICIVCMNILIYVSRRFFCLSFCIHYRYNHVVVCTIVL